MEELEDQDLRGPERVRQRLEGLAIRRRELIAEHEAELKRINEEFRPVIVAACDAGLSVAEIGKITGMTRQRIHAFMAR